MMKAGVRQKPDVAALASRDARRVTVLAWHYHDDDVAGPDAAVTLSLEGLGLKQGKAKLQHFRIDATHSNAYTAWQRLGSPAAPTRRAIQAARGREPAGAARRRAGHAWRSSTAGRRSRSRCRAGGVAARDRVVNWGRGLTSLPRVGRLARRSPVRAALASHPR